MAAVYTQYQPISDHETGDGSPLTVRAGRDIAVGLNNAKRYAMVDKVLSHISPVGTQSADGYTTERVALVFAPRVVPRGFPSLRWWLGQWRASGTGQTTWRLYSMPTQYRGAEVLDTSMLAVGSQNARVITDSGTYGIATNTVTIVRATGDITWLMLTAENNVDSSYSKLYTLDAWPVM